jgi:hypothetical protein
MGAKLDSSCDRLAQNAWPYHFWRCLDADSHTQATRNFGGLGCFLALFGGRANDIVQRDYLRTTTLTVPTLLLLS